MNSEHVCRKQVCSSRTTRRGYCWNSSTPTGARKCPTPDSSRGCARHSTHAASPWSSDASKVWTQVAAESLKAPIWRPDTVQSNTQTSSQAGRLRGKFSMSLWATSKEYQAIMTVKFLYPSSKSTTKKFPWKSRMMTNSSRCFLLPKWSLKIWNWPTLQVKTSSITARRDSSLASSNHCTLKSNSKHATRIILNLKHSSKT